MDFQWKRRRRLANKEVNAKRSNWVSFSLYTRCDPELADALVEQWSNISQQELTNLVQSMRMRCSVVLKAAGGHQILTVLFRDSLFYFCSSNVSETCSVYVSVVESFLS
ncbi:hypothetical protein AMELA_G00091200 [Ameiurus melas]|uniref:Uncharacterized protein n=1 Tax=Ameiurus melas TaxID=219545 RepID=A0A7J6AVX7_AMEME|nr:hypothetical protein AMELA_G00091200 [Ameiurus melas]